MYQIENKYLGGSWEDTGNSFSYLADAITFAEGIADKPVSWGMVRIFDTESKRVIKTWGAGTGKNISRKEAIGIAMNILKEADKERLKDNNAGISTTHPDITTIDKLIKDPETLRDLIAIVAMHGIIGSTRELSNKEFTTGNVAGMAYSFANEMIKRREKND